ncbi:MAG: carbamoyltransferase C-terminal domain-containing protein [Solirubrobacterales bacterium]
MGRGRGSNVFGKWGPKRPRLTKRAGALAHPLLNGHFARKGVVEFDSDVARSRFANLERAIADGRESYLLGFGVGFHNSGVALVRVSPGGRLELICNEEEERYAAEKHCSAYPEHAVEAVKRRMEERGVRPADLVACLGSWEFGKAIVSITLGTACEEAPHSLTPQVGKYLDQLMRNDVVQQVAASPARLAEQLGLDEPLPVIGMRHHDNHAYLGYALSPFAAEPGPTMVLVLDGSGDDTATSLFKAEDGRLELLKAQDANTMDSLGTLYGFLSSTQGGWPILSSEGRYMGAAAWGDGNRLTNGYYRRLRQIVYFGAEGEVRLNRALANWTRGGLTEPYTEELIDILGEPIAPEKMWHPDAVLNVEDVRHPEVTRERVDKAAAVQMVFEDAVAHIVEHLIRATGSDRLVLSGGTALNCVANMRLLDSFDERWYERQLGREGTRLRLWVPPIPGDVGTPPGAAYAFAMRAGARPGQPLKHAFYCGSAPSTAEVRTALDAEPTVASMALGDCSDSERLGLVADLLAHALAEDRILGLCQGASETGPRALGHRSILANPCNPETRRLLNERVKHRELIRPLAPMVTREAAERLFELQRGAAADDYSAYNYMVLTARAKPEARGLVPAVIHHDGTGRLQIVRPETDPFSHAFLVAMGRRVGVEASVNTSLNVGAPIAHTPEQAIETLKRARGMDGLLMIDEERQATLIWLEDRPEARERLMGSVDRWATETGAELPAAPLGAS